MHPPEKPGAGTLRIALWAICGLVTLLVAEPALSYRQDSGTDKAHFAQWLYVARNSISLDEAVSRVRRQTNGKILAAKTVRIDGRPVHVIKVLTPDGRVKRIRVDAGG